MVGRESVVAQPGHIGSLCWCSACQAAVFSMWPSLLAVCHKYRKGGGSFPIEPAVIILKHSTTLLCYAVLQDGLLGEYQNMCPSCGLYCI